MRGKNFFRYLSRIEGTPVSKNKIFELLCLVRGEQAEICQHGNHARAAVEMTMAHRSLRSFAPDHHVEAVFAGKDNYLGDAGQTRRCRTDEITPRHQKRRGESGDRSLGGCFVCPASPLHLPGISLHLLHLLSCISLHPLAMMATCGIVALSYILPLSAIAAAGIPVDQFTTGSWTDAARLLAGPWLAVAIVIGGIINGVGMFNALTLSYTRLPVVMAEDRMMPSALARRNRRRSPWVAIVLCGLGWALALGFTYERLISIDLILYGASLVLEFAALIALRIKQPDMVRPFRIPGGMVAVWVVSVCPVALLVYAAYASRSEQVAHMPALLFGLLVAAGGPVCYLLSRWWWGKPLPTPQPTEIAAD